MKLSDKSKNLIYECRKIAERYENGYIDLNHFYLVYGKAKFKDALDFKLSVSDVKKIIIQLKEIKLSRPIEDSFPVTKMLGKAFDRCGFHRWILSDEEVEPMHIYLSLVALESSNRRLYWRLLEDSNVAIVEFKGFFLNFYFNKFMRIFGLAKLVRIFF